MPQPETLAELQRLMFDLVVCAPGRSALSAAERAAPPATTWLTGSEVAVARGAHIYRDGYFARLHDVLCEHFPCVRALVGDGAFRELAADYLTVHPPVNASLRFAGARLPALLRARELAARGPVLSDPAPARVRELSGGTGGLPRSLSDLARLEWARVEVFDAANVEVLALADLAALPPTWTTSALPLVPAFRILELDHAVDEAWTAIHGRLSVAHDLRDGCAASPIEVTAGPRTILVWRRAMHVYHRAAPLAEATALARLAAGGSFADACASYARTGEASPAAVSDASRAALGALSQWIADEMLLGIPRP